MNKKLISLLLALTLVVSMSVSVYALAEDEPIGPFTVVPIELPNK